MAAYVDYKYYTEQFGGAAIPETEFATYALQASRKVDSLTLYRIQNNDNPKGYVVDSKVKNAVCAVADVIYQNDKQEQKRGDIASETVGRHSVTYNVDKPGEKERLLNSKINSVAVSHLATTGLLNRRLPVVSRNRLHCLY